MRLPSSILGRGTVGQISRGHGSDTSGACVGARWACRVRCVGLRVCVRVVPEVRVWVDTVRVCA